MLSSEARATRRARFIGAVAIGFAFVVAACGGSASPPASPSQAVAPSVAPSVAPPSVTPSVASPSVAASAPAASGGTGSLTDPAEGITIGAPYSIEPLPAAMQTAFETQMKTSLGSLGANIGFGFRMINGGAGQNFLMVLAFPNGELNAAAFTGMVGGIGASMGATLTKTSSDGVDIYAGASATGGISLFQAGDHAIIVIAQASDDALAIAKALVSANK
jgi:hypothetical protein